jgi:hypothetical protein
MPNMYTADVELVCMRFTNKKKKKKKNGNNTYIHGVLKYTVFMITTSSYLMLYDALHDVKFY